jgi:hypothetical protein
MINLVQPSPREAAFKAAGIESAEDFLDVMVELRELLSQPAPVEQLEAIDRVAHLVDVTKVKAAEIEKLERFNRRMSRRAALMWDCLDVADDALDTVEDRAKVFGVIPPEFVEWCLSHDVGPLESGAVTKAMTWDDGLSNPMVAARLQAELTRTRDVAGQ